MLHEHGNEQVSLIRAAAGERVALPAHYETREMLVLAGQVTWQAERTRVFDPWGWIRLHPGHPLRVETQQPSVLFTKTRPLTAAQRP